MGSRVVSRVAEYEARRGRNRAGDLNAEARLLDAVQSGRAKPLSTIVKRKLHEVRLHLSAE